MKIALNGQQLAATHDLAGLCDVLDHYGVRYVELWPANLPGGTDALEQERYEAKDVAAAARLLKSRGIEVACVTLGFWAAQLCIARGGTAALSEALGGAVDAAVTFGARLVNCYSVGIPFRLFRAAVTPAAKYAADRGVVITLENEAHDESFDPRAIAKLVADVGSPGFATQYDPCNYYHGGVEPYPAAYEAVRPHVRYVHLKGGCHFDPAHAGTFKGSLMRDESRGHIGYLPLPDAGFPVEAIVRRLRRDGYDGFVTLEPHVPASHVTSYYDIELPYLRRLIGQA